MINEFKNNLNKKFPFLEGKKLLVTISGGIDSVVLTHLLHELDYNISLAHVNFHLRGTDSNHDQEFVQQLASKLHIPIYQTDFNTKEYATQHKLSTQEAARNLRYNWFEEIRKKHQLDYILTGHNLNDSLETLLFNLARGTGLKGLTGINTVYGKIIRPLSDFSRDDISVYAFISNIEWREDKSNAKTKYTRNKIRHQIIPILQEINSNLLDSFKQTLENLQGSQDIIHDRIKTLSLEDKKSKSNTTFDIKNLKINIQTNPKAYIHNIFSPYGFTNPKDIVHLLDAQSGKQVFSKTHRLLKDRGFLLLEEQGYKKQELRNKKQEPRSKSQEKRDEFLIFENDTTINLEDSKLSIQSHQSIHSINSIKSIHNNKNTAQFDKDLLKFPLTVRKWQKGDYFYPIGMRGKKKLSKFFKDEKLSLIDKENIWLLLSDNEVVWVIGMREDERFKITETTNTITKINVL